MPKPARRYLIFGGIYLVLGLADMVLFLFLGARAMNLVLGLLWLLLGGMWLGAGVIQRQRERSRSPAPPHDPPPSS